MRCSVAAMRSGLASLRSRSNRSIGPSSRSANIGRRLATATCAASSSACEPPAPPLRPKKQTGVRRPNTSGTVPFITITIIVINALAWFVELGQGPRDLNRFLYIYGHVPGDFHAATLVTSMFLHGSWSHILGNMLYLWIF